MRSCSAEVRQTNLSTETRHWNTSLCLLGCSHSTSRGQVVCWDWFLFWSSILNQMIFPIIQCNPLFFFSYIYARIHSSSLSLIWGLRATDQYLVYTALYSSDMRCNVVWVWVRVRTGGRLREMSVSSLKNQYQFFKTLNSAGANKWKSIYYRFDAFGVLIVVVRALRWYLVEVSACVSQLSPSHILLNSLPVHTG